VLNCCRALAFSRTGRVMSKVGGGEWGARELPAEFGPLAAQALAAYQSEPGIGDDLDVDAVRHFSEWAEARL